MDNLTTQFQKRSDYLIQEAKAGLRRLERDLAEIEELMRECDGRKRVNAGKRSGAKDPRPTRMNRGRA